MFEIIHKIGKGSSGYVYKALNKKDKKFYAIKQSLSPDNDELIKNEIAIYQKFKNECSNIIHFYDYFKANNETGQTCLCMQIEYCQYGSIREIIKKGKKKNIFINELEISAIIYMVLKSLVYIHKNNLVDRDIKGRNILVDKDGTIKLCDFGICKPYHKNNMKHLRGGSPYWMSPEVLNKEEYDQTIDIWALGITCIELAENEPPYFNLSPKEVMKQITKSPPKGLNDKSKWSYDFNNFISCCLNIDRFKRPSAEQLLKHDFITSIDKKNLNRKLLILQFLSKCGYKILYNRKVKIIHTLNGNGNISNKNHLFNNKILYHKKGLVDIRKKNNVKMFNSQINSNSKSAINKACENFEYNKSSKKLTDNNGYKGYNNEKRISLNPSDVFARKILSRCRSLEKEIDKYENRIKINNNIRTNLIYKRNNKLLGRASSNGYKHNLTLENNSLNSANSSNINNKNSLYDSSNDKKNKLLKTFLKEKKIKNLGREFEDNFDEHKELLEEEDEEDENNKKEKDKIIEDEIKELLKQRDIEINNIMLKYQNKLDKMKKEQIKNNTIEK